MSTSFTFNFQNLAIQFAATAAVVYFMGTTDTGTIVQLGAISVMSAIVAEQFSKSSLTVSAS